MFNVRGTIPQYESEKDILLDTLRLAFTICDQQKTKAFRIDKEKGLVLYWANKSDRFKTINEFITPLTAEQVYPQVQAFLTSYYDGEIEVDLEEFDRPMEEEDDDITSVKGWRIYTERWGRIDGDSYAFLAIKPAYDNYGK